MAHVVSIKSLKSDLIFNLNKCSDKIVDTFKNHITDILSYKSRKWVDVVDPKVKQKTIEILLLTKKLKPESSITIDNILNSKLDHAALLYDENGKWQELNKLNTNKSDLPIFIADLVVLFPEFEIPKIINEILVGNYNTLSKCINKAKENPELIWNKLLNKPEKYTQHIREYSKKGQKMEDDIRDEYIKSGWEIVHQGGDGDLIDMKLGVDLIVKKGEKYLFLQIKKVYSINDVEIDNQSYVEVNGDTYLKNYSFIDAIIYCTTDGKKVGVKNQIYYIKKRGRLFTEKGFPCPSRVNENSIYLKK